jgi:tRNA(Ile)-lysidine synthase
VLSEGVAPGLPRLTDLFAPLQLYRRIGLAVSGGPDSLALMVLAARWAGDRDDRPTLIVYTVDHGLRPEAADEVAMVVGAAHGLGLKARALKWHGVKPATGIQAAARTARYRLMAQAMAEDAVDVLVTAHHADDQAETVLMRLSHGSGIDGLGGMRPTAFVEGVEIVRPLLGLAPAELRAVVDRAGLVPVADPSNSDLDYERVRWRQALPGLSELGLTAERLGRFARRMRDLEGMLAELTEVAFADTVRMFGEDEAALDHVKLRTLPGPVAVRLIGNVLGLIGQWQKPHAIGQVEDLAARLGLPGALKPLTLHGCIVSSDGRSITVRREPGRLSRASRTA